jgi:protein-tyrosine kinase
MSRIHEALKKAAQERAGNQSTEVTGSLLDSPMTPAVHAGNGAAGAVTDVFPQTVIVPASRADYLRFDELRTHCARPTWHPDINSNVFIHPLPDTHAAEQFRTLRSRLYQLRGTQPLRTLLVTSSMPGEGKTFVSNNLAHAVVRQPDRRALLIDADLRCPRLHKVLGAPAGPGLVDYLNGTADQMAIIQQGPDPGLCFIPAGVEAANPSELLSNGKIKTLLDALAPVFDWIILDSPPCLPVADASMLANLCDGVLLVVRAELTPSAAAQKACQELQGRNIVGVVLNGATETNSYASSYYYQDPATKVESKQQ